MRPIANWQTQPISVFSSCKCTFKKKSILLNPILKACWITIIISGKTVLNYSQQCCCVILSHIRDWKVTKRFSCGSEIQSCSCDSWGPRSGSSYHQRSRDLSKHGRGAAGASEELMLSGRQISNAQISFEGAQRDRRFRQALGEKKHSWPRSLHLLALGRKHLLGGPAVTFSLMNWNGEKWIKSDQQQVCSNRLNWTRRNFECPKHKGKVQRCTVAPPRVIKPWLSAAVILQFIWNGKLLQVVCSEETL